MRLALVLLLAPALARTARGQDAATVPPSSDVYRRIEAVGAVFPAVTHLGQQPASRRALAAALTRLHRAAYDAPLGHPRRGWALAELEEIDALIDGTGGEGRRAHLGWSLDAYSSNAPPTRIAANGLGLLDAIDAPFGHDRRGLPAPNGAAVVAMPTVVWGGANAAVLVEPAVGWLGDSSGMHGYGRLRRWYARGVARNVAVQVGADDRRWGQSQYGPLFLSGNAEPLPALSLGTDTAVVLPWIFSVAGPVQGTLLVADLGGGATPEHARLAGWQLGIAPWTRFELGVAVLVHTGGSGGPKATFLERVVDLFPAIDALAPQHADLQISNKIAGGNLRLRLPELSALDVYYELAIDDFDGRRLRSSLVEDAAHLLGARVGVGPTVVRGEWHRTSLRFAEHTQFPAGLTHRQRLLGSPLGPNATAGYLGAEWTLRNGAAASVTLGDERRDPSQYTVTVTGERDRGFTFIRVTRDAPIRRRSLVGSLDGAVGSIGARVTYGMARSWRPGGAARVEWLSRVELRSQVLPQF